MSKKIINLTVNSFLRHDNHTGRWLTPFRATWDPKTENCFVIGSLGHPRKVVFILSNNNFFYDCIHCIHAIRIIFSFYFVQKKIA